MTDYYSIRKTMESSMSQDEKAALMERVGAKTFKEV
jgi:hypothetical protein